LFASLPFLVVTATSLALQQNSKKPKQKTAFHLITPTTTAEVMTPVSIGSLKMVETVMAILTLSTKVAPSIIGNLTSITSALQIVGNKGMA
jgi:hypothetical protein